MTPGDSWLGTSGPVLDSSSSFDRRLALLGSPGTSPEEDREAALTLAAWARDAGELRAFLEACGLLPYDHKPRTNFMPRGRVITGYRRPLCPPP